MPATNFIFYVNPTVTLICVPPDAPAVYSLDTAADLTGVHPDLLRHYCELGLLGADRAGRDREPIFDDNALFEARRIEEYRRQHGVNRRALPVLCDLWHEVERLQAEVRFLRTP
jgi:DNA-binding transcriptional MerR regulator